MKLICRPRRRCNCHLSKPERIAIALLATMLEVLRRWLS
jgi:hypothetical protein